jgi:hypothetical protein
MERDNQVQSELELVVGKLYSFKELEDNNIELHRFYSRHSVFTNGDGRGHLFTHQPFKQLKIRFKYVRPLELPSLETYTTFDDEWYEEELKNCCGPLRFGIDEYK